MFCVFCVCVCVCVVCSDEGECGVDVSWQPELSAPRPAAIPDRAVREAHQNYGVQVLHYKYKYSDEEISMLMFAVWCTEYSGIYYILLQFKKAFS